MVFISYRHESEAHSGKVRLLAESLRSRLAHNRIEVVMDSLLLDEQPGGPECGWPMWCEHQLQAADRVVIIASHGWAESFSGQRPAPAGAGAAYEAQIIRNELYQSGVQTSKYRVCLLDPADADCIPTLLQGLHHFVLPADEESLCAWLAARPASPRKPGLQRAREEALWMLCQIDRTHQARELTTAWTEHTRRHLRRPLVCFIHGATNQCHHEFLQRLEEEFLPTLPNLLQPDAALRSLTLEWPKEFADPADFKDQLRWALGGDLLRNPASELTEIHRGLASHPGPIVVSTQLLDARWERRGPEAVQAFLQFWAECPDLINCPGLLVLVCVIYKADERLLHRLLGRRSGQALRTFLGRQLALIDQSRATVKSLSELGNIEQDEALTWVKTFAPRLGDAAGDLRSRINLLYATTDSIPMERLVRELKPCLAP